MLAEAIQVRAKYGTDGCIKSRSAILHIQMRLDQVVNTRGELHLGQVTAAGQHDETSVGQRGSRQALYRRGRDSRRSLPGLPCPY